MSDQNWPKFICSNLPSDISFSTHAQQEDIYVVKTQDFFFGKIKWPCSNTEDFKKSKFDDVYCKKWENAMQNGFFRYNLDEIKRKTIDGSIGFIAQLNTKRFKERRKPQEMHFVRQHFEEDKFNFTKILHREKLFNLAYNNNQHQPADVSKDNILVINVSPIDYGHSLLVPDIKACHPQALNFDAIKCAIDICLLSHHRGLRIGFNSLCAFASVNHLHLHILYINHRLPIDEVEVFYHDHGLFVMDSYPVRGFALQLENNDIIQLSRRVYQITSYLYENDIAHNVFISRHDNFIIKNYSRYPKDINQHSVRVFIFPKHSTPGRKESRFLNSCCFDLAGYLLLKAITDCPFNAAALELAGFIPVQDKNEFDNLTEAEAVSILNRFSYFEDEFSELKDNICSTFQNLEQSNI